MTHSSPDRRLVTAAAWLLLCALATAAVIQLTPVWAKVLCLIAAAAALRAGAMAAWTARSTLREITPREPGRIYLRGEISATTAGETTRRLTRALATRPTTLEIDMSKVELLTSDGAMAFLSAARIAREQGTEVTIRNASPQARAVLHKLGLDQLHHYRH
ncbi:STAS domain-containing protein [Streptomyces mesophilus]|uniref:STAS domain-containing protein n=1 Tax=Streptomyces mesophilus TaxID=1775132 RepID=UPI003324022B